MHYHQTLNHGIPSLFDDDRFTGDDTLKQPEKEGSVNNEFDIPVSDTFIPRSWSRDFVLQILVNNDFVTSYDIIDDEELFNCRHDMKICYHLL